MEQEIVRYRTPTRILHWIHAGSFVVLFFTGLILFIPALGFLAEDSWTRVLHRIAVVFFVVAPLIYIPLNWKATWRGVKEAFSWGGAIGWLKAAPRYYFRSDEEAMPPQEHMNIGQKMWWSMVLVGGLVFVITGLIMWAFKTTAPAALLQWMVLIHDVAFIATGCMLFVHIYLSVVHPLTRTWGAMARGKVSVDHAKAHHAKWYDRVAKGE